MKTLKINRVLNFFVCLLLVLSLFVFNKSDVNASVDTNFKIPTESIGEFTPRGVSSLDYEEATNSFDDGDVKYYLITHDVSKVGLTEIEYKGTTYQLEAVEVVPEEFNFLTFELTDKNGNKIKPLNGISNDENFTLFFDDGIYHDLSSTNYTAFSHENGSYVGLNKVNDEPAAIISKAARTETDTVPSIAGLVERNIISKGNIYIENLTFDGRHRDMIPVGYKQNGKTKKYRGCYYFIITGGHQTDPNLGRKTEGLVMRDLIIENIGDGDDSNDGYSGFFTSDTRRKNVAINVIYNPGKVNIEDITIRNVETVSNYGVVQLQDSDDIYVKGINIDMAEAGLKALPIKVETTNLFGAFTMQEQKYVIDDIVTENVQDSEYDNIYVQDYRYDYVKLPKEYKYASWNIVNGSLYSASFNAYKDLPKAKPLKAIQDLTDNYWIVDTSSEDVTIEQQLENIGLVINYTKEDVVNQKSPKAQIKFIGDEIPSFDFPAKKYGVDLWKNADGTDMGIDIVAVKSVDIDVMEKSEMIPTTIDFKAKFNNIGLVNLYNFDFKENSKYTYHEVNYPLIHFVVTDPNDGNYPQHMNAENYWQEVKDSAIMKNDVVAGEAAKGVNYHNCLFVGLVSRMHVTFDAVLNNGKYEMDTTEEKTITVGINDDETYTTVANLDNFNAKKADDEDLYYESSDSEVATVDENGKVTALKEGEATIYIKTKDTFNGGEIEKPYYSFKLVVNKKAMTFKAIHKFVSSDPNLELPEQVLELLPNDIKGISNNTEVVPVAPTKDEVSVIGGKWVFKGYETSSLIINNSDVEFKGIWEFVKDDVVEKEVTTKWVDENGKDLKPAVTAKTAKEAGNISGYTFVKSEMDKDGNVTHHFKKNVPMLPKTGETNDGFILLTGGICLIGALLLIFDKKYRTNK